MTDRSRDDGHQEGAAQVRGPYFDELEVGDRFDGTAVTLTSGMQAVHLSIVGNRLRLGLDEHLARRVAGRPIVSPALVWDVAIGQSTLATQHVRANLFYRGLEMLRHPAVGDTLHTVTVVEAMRENRRRDGRPPTGMVVLRIQTCDQRDRPVLDFWRCAMIPLAPGAGPTGHRDDLDVVGAAPRRRPAPATPWDLAAYRAAVPAPHFDALRPGRRWVVEGADVVTGAPELARLTGNLAAVHHDADVAGGRRLVYGGHTIGLALHQVARAVPGIVTVCRWERCDHVGAVHEGDILRSTVTVEELADLPDGGGLAWLRSKVDACAGDGSRTPVLDWSLTALMA